jgi:PAS domain S-box-containing protein
MANLQNKTKSELIKELQKLQLEYESLKKSSENDSNEKLKILFETMSEGVALNEIVFNDNGEMVDYRIIEVNPSFYSTADFEPGEVIGKLATQLYGMSQEYIKSFWQTHKGEAEVIHTEMLSPRRNRYYYISTSPFLNNRFVTSFIDITDRKRDEEALRKSHDLLNATFDSLNDAVFILDEKSVVVDCNQAASQIFGYHQDEIQGQTTAFLHIDESTLAEFRQQLYSAIEAKGKLDEFEFRMKRRDGTIFATEHSVMQLLNVQGMRSGWVSVVRDISGPKQTEEVLKQTEEMLRIIADNTPDHIIIQDIELKYIMVINPQLGLNQADMLGKTDNDFLEKKDAENQTAIKKNVLKTGKQYHVETSLINKKGETEYFDGTYVPQLDADGKPIGLIGYFRNVTEHKLAEDELRNSKELLESLNQHLHEVWESEKSQIAMNLHDDLGQKLTALYMDIAWIKSRMGVQSAGVMKKLSGINTNLNEIIEGIKDVSFSLMPAILFELGIVPAIISHLNKFEKQSGIKCSFDYDPEEIAVEEGLSLVIYRVFQESLTNIARHSQARHTEVSLRMLKGNIELSVKDDGIGIDKDKINSLTSMGMAGIKARVRLVNGSVSFIGKKGSGTNVKATFPLNKNK